MNHNVFNNNFDEGQPSGLRQNIRDALPTLKFKKDNFKNAGVENQDKLECRICMTEFAENDNLRMLTCMHHFHQ